MMAEADILGKWKSVLKVKRSGDAEPCTGKTLTFHILGNGEASPELFRSRRYFSWEYIEHGRYGDDYFLFGDLGGLGPIKMASVEDGKLIVMESNLMYIYVRK